MLQWWMVWLQRRMVVISLWRWWALSTGPLMKTSLTLLLLGQVGKLAGNNILGKEEGKVMVGKVDRLTEDHFKDLAGSLMFCMREWKKGLRVSLLPIKKRWLVALAREAKKGKSDMKVERGSVEEEVGVVSSTVGRASGIMVLWNPLEVEEGRQIDWGEPAPSSGTGGGTTRGKVFSEMLKLEGSSCYSSKVMPRLGWFLANIINLVTENVHDSGQFVKGVDLKTYTLVVNCIGEKLLDWFENTGQLKENSNDGKQITGDTCMEMSTDICCKLAPCGSLKTSSTDLFKPVCQQWHLRHLLSAAEKCILNNEAFLAAESQTFKCHGNLELLDIVLFYYYMIRICSFLAPLVGSLPILNMLSFTPGFVVKLWEQLENYIFHNNIRATDANKSFRDKNSWHNNGEHTRMSKDPGNKWVNVLAKITGKSCDVDLSHSSIEELSPSNVDSSEYDLWDVEHLRQGNQGISRNLQYTLHLFCSVYAHLLLVLDDIEFYDKQVPFTLWQQQRISSVLNTFVYGSFIHNCGLSNKPLMDAAVRCLSLLYERDCRHKFCLPSLWVAPARRGRLPIAAAARSHEAVSSNHRCGDTSSNHRTSSVISTIPHVFPFEERVQMFREFIKLDKDARRIAGESTGLGSGSIEIVIRRDHIVEDGFQQLNVLGSKLKSCFNISFISECGLPEAGLDYGGLSKEFLTDVSKAAFDPKYGLFSQSSTSEGFLVPNSSARFLENGIEMIEFLGRIVGKALYEGILLDYSFTISFVQKLLGRYSFLDELSTLDPELYRNLMYVKVGMLPPPFLSQLGMEQQIAYVTPSFLVVRKQLQVLLS
ncbi:hypothetical protein Taro_023442 [Colocasia esculenta]|uniref:HECT-type E3 ubiquitin transferase n=1 Tax=Colocasia esculenta TaxID=4460 RepID=A0A843VAT7_COLES|nr:hypothetical protein [Colocasia esculenta]